MYLTNEPKGLVPDSWGNPVVKRLSCALEIAARRIGHWLNWRDRRQDSVVPPKARCLSYHHDPDVLVFYARGSSSLAALPPNRPGVKSRWPALRRFFGKAFAGKASAVPPAHDVHEYFR